jgi:hypothetical protein
VGTRTEIFCRNCAKGPGGTDSGNGWQTPRQQGNGLSCANCGSMLVITGDDSMQAQTRIIDTETGETMPFQGMVAGDPSKVEELMARIGANDGQKEVDSSRTGEIGEIRPVVGPRESQDDTDPREHTHTPDPDGQFYAGTHTHVPRGPHRHRTGPAPARRTKPVVTPKAAAAAAVGVQHEHSGNGVWNGVHTHPLDVDHDHDHQTNDSSMLITDAPLDDAVEIDSRGHMSGLPDEPLDPGDAAMRTDVVFVGPISKHLVMLNGRIVPFLEGVPPDKGMASLVLDERFFLEVPEEYLDAVVAFTAHAIAVAMGFQSHPSDEEDPEMAHPFRRMIVNMPESQ